MLKDLLTAGLVAGTLATSPAIAQIGELQFPDIHVGLPDLGAERLRIEDTSAAALIARVKPGLLAGELEQMLGQPSAASREGGTLRWDYNVAFPVAGDTSELICQFKVVVAADGTVSSTHWRRRLCENLHQSLVSSAPIAPEVPPVEIVTLSADVLFPFGLAELTASGRESLSSVAGKLRADYTDPAITLVGHTDRIGSPKFNLELSQRRAEVVRGYLAELGLPSTSVVAEGRGDSQPVVTCEAGEADELKDCLQPNRRVELEIFERGTRTDTL